MVDEPSVHVSDPLDREPAAGQVRLERGQPGIRCFRQGRRLLPDADILSGPAGQHPADARESEVDITGQAASDGGPASRVVAQEQDRWLPRQAGKTGAGGVQLITPDRNQDDVVMAAGIRTTAAPASASPPPITSRARRPPAATSSVLGPCLSTETAFPAAASWAP